MVRLMRGFALLVALLLAVMMYSVNRRAMPLAEQYPGPWQQQFSLAITRALSGAGARGCGEYWWQESTLDAGQYLVRCLDGAGRWTQWTVWLPSGRALGPHAPDPAIAAAHR